MPKIPKTSKNLKNCIKFQKIPKIRFSLTFAQNKTPKKIAKSQKNPKFFVEKFYQEIF